jgi:hypothetical protein
VAAGTLRTPCVDASGESYARWLCSGPRISDVREIGIRSVRVVSVR